MSRLTVSVMLLEDSHPLSGAMLQLRNPRTEEPISPTIRTNRRGLAGFEIPDDEGLPFPHSGIDIDLCILGERDQVMLQKHITSRQISARRVSIPLTITQATEFGLYRRKQRRTTEQHTQEWCLRWKKAKEADMGPRTGETLCMTRVLLDMMADIENPSGRVGKMVAKLANKHLGEEELVESAHAAKRARDIFDACRFPDILPKTCNANLDWKVLAESIFTGDGSGSQLMHALTATTTDPRENLGMPSAGIPFTRQPEFVKHCLEKLRVGSLQPDIQETMQQLIDENVQVLFPPSVNLVETWNHHPLRSPDDHMGQTVRFGEVHNELLTVKEFGVPAERTFSTDVELDDPECFILEADEDGRQRFFTDVKTGQVIRLKGSSFISATAQIRVEFRRIKSVDEQGRIIFRDHWEGVPGFNGSDMDVHGYVLPDEPYDTQTQRDPQDFNLDEIVFEWPAAAAEPGLYRVQLAMENHTEHYIEITQDLNTCEISMVKDGIVQSNPIHFVVVPEVMAKRVQITGTKVRCADETDPEEIMFVNLADDVIYEMVAERFEFMFDPNESDPIDAVSLDGIEAPGMASGRRLFWDAPDTWFSGLQPFPEAPEIFTTLDLNQVVNLQMVLFESDSETDQYMLKGVLVLAAIALVVVIMLIVAAAIILLIATGVIAVTSFGAGAALTVIVAALAGFLFGAAFTALISVIDLIVAAVPSVEIIGKGGTGFVGKDLAYRMSPIRLHRLFFQQERPQLEDPTANLEVIESDFANGDYREVFRVKNLGGRYEITLTVNAD